MEFIEFLSLDEENENNFKPIFTYLLNSLENYEDKVFNSSNTRFWSIIQKYLNLLSKNNCAGLADGIKKDSNNFLTSLRLYISLSNENRKTAPQFFSRCKANYQSLHDRLVKSYMTLIGNSFSRNIYGEFSSLYIPDNSNKNAAFKLIEEAINLIRNDSILLDKHKNQIIRNLEKAIANIKDEKTNWAAYFGTIKEAVVIIGALVTIFGPNYNLDNLITAKDKLNESIITIEESSINQNYIEFTPDDSLIISALEDILQITEETEPDTDEDNTPEKKPSD